MASGLPVEKGTRKFLIVDDHAGFRRTLRAFLPAGVVTECSDGGEVLACYDAERPDWVLMDIEMAGMDGLTATRLLRQRFPDARVIIVSQHAEEEFQAAARKLGVRGFVRKERLAELRDFLETPD